MSESKSDLLRTLESQKEKIHKYETKLKGIADHGIDLVQKLLYYIYFANTYYVGLHQIMISISYDNDNKRPFAKPQLMLNVVPIYVL